MYNIKTKSLSQAKGKYRFKKYKAGTKELLYTTPWTKNLVVSSENRGVNIFIKNMQGLFTYNPQITSASIGKGTTPASDSDTDLETPILEDILVATFEETDLETLTITFFIPDSELDNDTYTEFGMFCGTQLFARSIITPSYVKGSNEDTQCEYVININN
jgi:hypothetical protein